MMTRESQMLTILCNLDNIKWLAIQETTLTLHNLMESVERSGLIKMALVFFGRESLLKVSLTDLVGGSLLETSKETSLVTTAS